MHILKMQIYIFGFAYVCKIFGFCTFGFAYLGIFLFLYVSAYLSLLCIMLYQSSMQKICTKYARNMPKYAYYMPMYALEMQLYARNMQNCNNIDGLSQIRKRYALNMPEICLNVQLICSYMLQNSNKDCNRQICKKNMH